MKIELTDLRHFSPDMDKCLTEVRVYAGTQPHRNDGFCWLQLGRCDLLRRDATPITRWSLQSRLYTATDFEHDAADIVRLPLVAVEFDIMFGHRVHLTAIIPRHIDWDCGEFAVPLPGYDPLAAETTSTCERCSLPHPLVGSDHYIPPFNEELFNLVAGHPVVISIGNPSVTD